MSSPFSPLGREYCNYFYYVSIISFVLLVIAVISLIFTLALSKSKDKLLLLHSIPAFISLLLSYFTNRLLYSMCVGSLK